MILLFVSLRQEMVSNNLENLGYAKSSSDEFLQAGSPIKLDLPALLQKQPPEDPDDGIRQGIISGIWQHKRSLLPQQDHKVVD